MSVRTFPFPSRSSGATHTVTVGANNHIVCTCRGFDSPSKCWHVREVAEKLGLPNTAMSTTPPLPWGSTPTPAHDFGPMPSLLREPEPDMFIEPMLGKALKEGDRIENYIDPMWTMEEKYDGHRIILHIDKHQVPRAWSRDHNPRELSRHIVNHLRYLAPGTYDGELFIPGKSSTDVTRKDLVHKHKLVLFDILRIGPSITTPLKADGTPGDTVEFKEQTVMHVELRNRRHLLEVAMSKMPKGEVFQAPVHPVSAEGLQIIWDTGREGVMLKRIDEPYQPERRVWLKFKKEHHGRMTVTGYKTGKLGPHSVVCGVDEHGVKVQCKTLNTVMRNTFDANPDWAIGRTLVFAYQQKTGDGRYRHPRAEYFESEK